MPRSPSPMQANIPGLVLGLTLTLTLAAVLGSGCSEFPGWSEQATPDTTTSEHASRHDQTEEDRSRRAGADSPSDRDAVTAPAQAEPPRTEAGRPQPPLPTVAPAPGMMGATAPMARMAGDRLRPPSEPVDRETYAAFEDNPVKRAAESPVSTFSIDVDSGAYANVRRFLNDGRLPPQNAVRVEELINYFSYSYAVPEDLAPPFSVHTEMGPTPWNAHTRLLKVGLKGYEVSREALPPANLVFLIDVSGSMRSPDKLDLLKRALILLSQQLDADDSVAIAVYAGASGVVLEPTPGARTGVIRAALEGLAAGGSTNGGAGIRLAYALAEQAMVEGGINRVILATDGDFNVGTVNFEALVDLIETKRETGIALTTLGFGTGNYNDHLMERLADAGNGNYAYIDSFDEARKALVDEIGSTLLTIAKDVKIQIEFNPAVVDEYRLIGYENRTLRREDFNNDQVDAGDIGAGHTVTALYEWTPVGSEGALMDPLRYGDSQAQPPRETASRNEVAFLRLRYKQPDGDASHLLETPILTRGIHEALEATSDDYRFAAAVAAFGQILRGGRYTGGFTLSDAAALAREARGDDASGYRAQFLTLARTAAALRPETSDVVGRASADRSQGAVGPR